MSALHYRGLAGPKPALVIEGEAVLVARHPRTKTWNDFAANPEAVAPRADEAAMPPPAFGRGRPQPSRRRSPPASDLIFQTAPQQRFVTPADSTRSVLPRSVWIAAMLTLTALAPLAALSVLGGGTERIATIEPIPAPAAAPAPKQEIRILSGLAVAPKPQLASSGESRPANLPGALGGVYPLSAGARPAGVARLGSVSNIADLKTAVRRTVPE